MAKKRQTINELAQLDRAYGRKLTLKRQFGIAVKPAIITTLYAFVLLGVVGMKSTEKATVMATMPEFQYFAKVDPDDAKTYYDNTKATKNVMYWESDMPSMKRPLPDGVKKNTTQRKAYDNFSAKFKEKIKFKNVMLSIISLWREAVFFVIGLLFGWFYVLPRQIKLEYNMNALAERNTAINLMTQSFQDTSQHPLFGLQTVRDNTHGKLKDDFKLLCSIVAKNENNESILKGITDITNEYSDDSVFGLFMQQVGTYIIKGDISQKTFNNLMMQHNEIVAQTVASQNAKQIQVGAVSKLMYMSFGVGLFVAFIVMKILGSDMFIEKVWGSMVGFGGSLVVAGGTLGIYALMMKYYFDNDLMSK